MEEEWLCALLLKETPIIIKDQIEEIKVTTVLDFYLPQITCHLSLGSSYTLCSPTSEKQLLSLNYVRMDKCIPWASVCEKEPIVGGWSQP